MANRQDIDTRGRYGNFLLTAIAILLGLNALRMFTEPSVVSARQVEPNAGYFYIEPGTTTLRKPDGTQQVQGKVVIDTRTGEVWGFPTLSGTPYPIDVSRTEPPVSSPMYLGKFDFSRIIPK